MRKNSHGKFIYQSILRILKLILMTSLTILCFAVLFFCIVSKQNIWLRFLLSLFIYSS